MKMIHLREGKSPDPEVVAKFAKVEPKLRSYYIMKWAEEKGIDSDDAMEMAGYERGDYIGAGAYMWNYVGEAKSESLQALARHVKESVPLCDSLFRYQSDAYFDTFVKAKQLREMGSLPELDWESEEMLGTDIGESVVLKNGERVWLDVPYLDESDMSLEDKLKDAIAHHKERIEWYNSRMAELENNPEFQNADDDEKDGWMWDYTDGINVQDEEAKLEHFRYALADHQENGTTHWWQGQFVYPDTAVRDDIAQELRDMGAWKGDIEESVDEIAEMRQLAGLPEAEYQGKEVELNKPKRGGSKKYYVYVKNPKTGNVKKISFGDPGLKTKSGNKGRAKSFAARHNCEKKNDKTKAGYWACRLPRYGLVKGGKWW